MSESGAPLAPPSFLVGFAKDLIAGTAGGTAGIVAGQPADTVKVRVQSAAGAVQPTLGVASRMLRHEGPASFFRGMLAPLVANAPINAIIFSVYGGIVRRVRAKTGRDPTLVEQLMAGAAGGAAQSIVACPSELVKIQQQIAADTTGGGSSRGSKSERRAAVSKPNPAANTQTTPTRSLHSGRAGAAAAVGCQRRTATLSAAAAAASTTTATITATAPRQPSSWSLISTRVRQAGVLRGAFQGWNATLLRDVPAFGTYFFTYEWFKMRIEKVVDPVSRIRITWWETSFPAFMAGGMAGVVSWTVTMPMDVVKSHVQSQRWDGPRSERAWLPVARRGFAKEGMSYFFRGMAPALLRAFPVSAVVFSVYEWVMRQLDSFEQGSAGGGDGSGEPSRSAPAPMRARPGRGGQDSRDLEMELGLPPRREDAREFQRRATYTMSATERELGLPPLRRRESYIPFNGRSFGEYSRRRSERMVRIERKQSERRSTRVGGGDDEERSRAGAGDASAVLVARGSDYRRSAQEIALGLPPLRVRHKEEGGRDRSRATKG
jgi:hypothetical protein